MATRYYVQAAAHIWSPHFNTDHIVCDCELLYHSIGSSILQFDIGLNSGYCAAWRPDTGDKRYEQQQERIWSPQLDAKDKTQDWSLFTYNTPWDTTTTKIPQGYGVWPGKLCWSDELTYHSEPEIRMKQSLLSSITDIAPGNDWSLRTILLPVYTFKGRL